jgi:hypothetical protein
VLGSDILDVAIGVICLFLLLSLICSAANELIEALWKNRCKDLEKGIIELVGGGPGSDFVSKIYNHGVVNSLFRGKYGTAPKSELPSYIPAANFALALLSIVKDTDEAKLPSNVRSALKSFRETAGNDEVKLQKNIEDWYNSAMDRVSGWYKRRTQLIIFVLGCTFTVLANADCLQYAQRLSKDASLRQSAVSFAEAAAKKDTSKNDTKEPMDQIKTEIGSLEGIGLPIGWAQHPVDLKGVGWAIYDHGVGWLLTAMALSLGAPFWFDTLNRIMIIRSTVKPREKSGDEASKDPSRQPVQTWPLQLDKTSGVLGGLSKPALPGGQGNTLPDSDEIDGCEVAIHNATSDEDLPAAEGGVA